MFSMKPYQFDSKFANNKVYLIDKITMKGKQYQQVKCHINWDTIKLNEKEYGVVRVAKELLIK